MNAWHILGIVVLVLALGGLVFYNYEEVSKIWKTGGELNLNASDEENKSTGIGRPGFRYGEENVDVVVFRI